MTEEAIKVHDPDPSQEEVFVSRVRSLDPGRLSALKRSAGKTIAESRNIGWFYGLLDSGQRGRDEEIFFLVATLLSADRRSIEGSRSFTGNLGKTMARAAGQGSHTAIERRFSVLLDATFDLEGGWKPTGGEMVFRLRQIVKLALSREVGVDWSQLLYDLLRWGSPAKFVQKSWAQAFFTPAFERNSESEGKETQDAD